jgi:hypothetical protein
MDFEAIAEVDIPRSEYASAQALPSSYAQHCRLVESWMKHYTCDVKEHAGEGVIQLMKQCC